MEWREFVGWLKTMRSQTQPAELSPDSWAGYDGDGWYQEQKRKRAQDRGW